MAAFPFGNETDFVTAFHKEDPRTIRYLFNEYYRTLVDFADLIVKHSGEAEDIVGTSFFKMMQKRHDLHSISAIKAFLFVVTKNACRNFLRNTKVNDRRKKELLHYFNKKLTEAEQFDPYRFESEIFELLFNAIDNMPAQRREVCYLHFAYGKDTRKIADMMNLDVQTVRNHKSKGIVQLKTAFSRKKLLGSTAFLIILSIETLYRLMQ